MPNLRDIKRHIQSVRGIGKVTKAMEVVSAAKNHRLQSRVDRSHAFAERSWEVLNHLATAAAEQLQNNPMLCGYPEVNNVGLILITSNRGMVGPYNHNVIDYVSRYMEMREGTLHPITIGKVGRRAMLSREHTIHADFSDLDDHVAIEMVAPIVQVVFDGFVQRTFDQVLIAYTQYRPGARMKPALDRLLPLQPTGPKSGKKRESQEPRSSREPRQYVFEPDPQQLLRALLPRVIRFRIYHALLESFMAENMSRVIAMQAANQNSAELINHLTMGYNKARQQAITAELLDIVGGSVAMSEG